MDTENKSWFNLFEYSDSTELPQVPAEFWYLQVLEIVLQLEGEHYLVLEYPFYSYNDVVNNKIEECIWAPPYSACKINIGAKRIRKVGQIKSEYQHFVANNAAFLKDILDYKLYTMGIGSYDDLTDNGSILEYKRSFREPHKWKCYFVKRFGLKNLDKFDLNNIVDPECIKGYAYLNVEQYSKLIVKNASNSTYYFKGKPLSSNITFLFLKDIINPILHNLNFISKEFLTYKEKGVLLSFDLIAFGKNQEIINDTFKTLERRGDEIADGFEFLLSNIFGVGLSAYNYNQYRLMGDGFIAASPLRHNYSIKKNLENDIVENQLSKTLQLISFIFDELKAKAPNYPSQISCRCSILFEEYYYGKVGGLICNKAEMCGRSILKTERLQGIINSWFAQGGAQKPGFIYIAIEKKLFNSFKRVFDTFNPDEVIEYHGSYKEFEDSVIIITKKI